MKTFLSAFRLFLVLSLVTGVIYPLSVWAVGQLFFREAAEGSLIMHDGKIVGSFLLAQKTTDPRYFAPRPSAGDYATVASGASNQAWTSAKLAASIVERRAAHGGGADVPADLLTASGSGLDPDLSRAAVEFQAAGVATARGFTTAQKQTLDELIARHAERGQFGPARVNILQLNLAIDAAFPAR